MGVAGEICEGRDEDVYPGGVEFGKIKKVT